MGLGEGKS